MDRMELLRRTELFVLDMDGTYYLGDRILPGARAFLDAAEAAGKSFLFFTNNSSRAPQDYIRKLARMDTEISPEQILTSGDVMISFLKRHHPGARVFLMGTEPLFASFRAAGIQLVEESPELVVVGFDQTLTYQRLTDACSYIRAGAGFYATHPDINCPTETGFIPDCGAICAAISLSTGQSPRITGKPYPETLEAVLERGQRLVAGRGGGTLDSSAITFVGDRLYTDVATGVQNGAMGALVLTGETGEGDIVNSEIQPDAVFASLGEMGEILSSCGIGHDRL